MIFIYEILNGLVCNELRFHSHAIVITNDQHISTTEILKFLTGIGEQDTSQCGRQFNNAIKHTLTANRGRKQTTKTHIINVRKLE